MFLQPAIPDPETALRKLQDVGGLYAVLGDTMCKFIEAKSTIYANATLSKEDFWMVPPFKRAMAFVFLLQHVLGFKSHKQWNNFSESDLKLNTRAFKRWIKYEKQVMQASFMYRHMPEKFDANAAGRKKIKYKKRRLTTAAGSTTESPKRKVFVVADDTTSEEEPPYTVEGEPVGV